MLEYRERKNLSDIPNLLNDHFVWELLSENHDNIDPQAREKQFHLSSEYNYQTQAKVVREKIENKPEKKK